ncbi:endo-1,3(4)-beta-glucanase [Ruminococcaceae bacterium KH2T8]|nr:endo-1,3(4)-beta-glucanase [Ruminococcaceae bacterium KH2T8]
MKRSIRLAAALLSTAVLFTSCSKTGESETSEVPAGESSASVSDGTSSGTEGTSSSSSAAAQGGTFTGTMPGGHLIPEGMSEYGSGYEGIEGTGNYNYGEALQKSILFYELQRSGALPEVVRCNWRGDSALEDGSDVGIDLTGGWYDAGDHVKFNLPMAYTASMLGWSLYEDPGAYEESGQLDYMLEDIRWVTDYLIRCHPEDEVFYYQVGDGGSDHSWWGPAEVMPMARPSYCVTASAPGSAVTGEASAALAIASIVFSDSDPDYAALCLEHAESLYEFSDSTRSDAGYTAANGFYDSWSGFYDELAWAGSWLYLATGDDSYLDNAESCFTQAGHDYDWSMCWDDVHIGAAVMLAKITEDQSYKDEVQQHLDYWSCGTSDGSQITYTPGGLAWLDSWGSLRYATTTAFVACVYSRWDGCPSDKADIYWDFAVSQAEYALGSTGFSYQIGYGEDYPEHPHHRTSQGSYCDNMNDPSEARHTLYGALVGGPDANDGYTDTVSDYCANEVACDYNAGFTGLLAAMYSEYHGQTLINFGAVEEVSAQEYLAECDSNVEGDDFIEIRAFIYNETAWPARAATDLEYRYFVDLSEVYEAGGDVDGITITTNYMQSGRVDGLKVWNEDLHIYYLSVVFDDGALFPGGQSQYKSEIQVRMTSPVGVWDNGNDYSYGNGDGAVLLEGGEVVAGVLPDDEGSSSGTSTGSGSSSSSSSATPTPASGSSSGSSSSTGGGSVTSGDLSISMSYDGGSSNANAISGTLEITNNGSGSIDLSDMTIEYYFTNDGGTMTFDCYHSALNSSSGGYTALTDNTSGDISSYSGTDCDSVLEISFSQGTLGGGDTLTVSFSCHRSDWQSIDLSNDYSHESVGNIVIRSGDSVIAGEEP